MRFICALLLPTVLLAGFGFSRINSPSSQVFVLILIISSSLYSNFALRAEAYQYMSFPIDAVTEFSHKVKASTSEELAPKYVIHNAGNDFEAMTRQATRPQCYQTLFGRAPTRKLVAGEIKKLINQEFNLINPSCYLYPDQNDCKVGSRISVTQRDEVDDLINHRNPNWKQSTQQILVNYVSFVGFWVYLISGLVLLISHLTQHRVVSSNTMVK